MMKICIVTATRSEYGLLRPLMSSLASSDEFVLQIIATGAHLSPEFGLTYKTLEKDGFSIDAKVEMLLSSDTNNAIVKSMGLGMVGYADAFSSLKPDVVIILGDRYEMLSVASAAAVYKIPIIHLHGGEITEGAYDDSFRHAITKLSHLHFTSTEEYRRRVIQLGEQPNSVFNVGAIGLDNIRNIVLLTKGELESDLGISFKTYNYQITFHPETLANQGAGEQFRVLLDAIDQQEDSFFIFSKANADTDGRIINQMIDEYVKKNPEKSVAFHTLGSLRFFSTLAVCTAIVGNSSSGILEAPSLKTATINIGDRQRGRVQASSIINVDCKTEAILAGFDAAKQEGFREKLEYVKNPYDNGGATEKIIQLLRSLEWNNKAKKFYNII